jgi:hypothetical protein
VPGLGVMECTCPHALYIYMYGRAEAHSVYRTLGPYGLVIVEGGIIDCLHGRSGLFSGDVLQEQDI